MLLLKTLAVTITIVRVLGQVHLKEPDVDCHNWDDLIYTHFNLLKWDAVDNESHDCQSKLRYTHDTQPSSNNPHLNVKL